jgi:hypothetical protein
VLAALGLAIASAGGCFSSLNGYFDCPPGHKDCKDAGLDASGGSAGAPAGGGAAAGNGGMSTIDGGVDADAGGLGGQGGSPGAAPGETCTTSQDCAAGTCSRGTCGPPWLLTYNDALDAGSDPAESQWIKFQVQITNRTGQSQPLSSLTVRYYFTPEDAVCQMQVLTTSAPPDDVSKVTGVFGQTANGWTYLEVGFTADAGTLGGSSSSGKVKMGIHDKDFATFIFFQRDDYSYMSVEHITLYLDSVLVAGIEPAAPPPM